MELLLPGVLCLSVLSGISGRLGGCGKQGQWYDFLAWPKTRDWGCSAIMTAVAVYMTGVQLQFWWIYALIFLLQWGAFSTYWDWLFKGRDCLWFSGLMVGVALTPILWINVDLWWLVALRMGILTVVWEALNRYLPDKVLIWRRDVVEEFSRYAVSL